MGVQPQGGQHCRQTLRDVRIRYRWRDGNRPGSPEADHGWRTDSVLDTVQSSPERSKHMKIFKTGQSVIAGMLLAFSSGAFAHTAWLEPEEGQENVYRLYFGGHAGELEAYDAKKLITVEAFDSRGGPVAVERDETDNGVLIRTPEEPALFA